jgi:hypothetical protein
MSRAIAMLILMSLSGPPIAHDKKAAATLTLTEGDVAAGVGFVWHKATLSYMGKTYRVDVQDLSVREVGVRRADAVGGVYRLKTVAQLNGRYAAEVPSRTDGVTTIKNTNGVVIEMKSMTPAASLKSAAGGIKLRVTD